MNRQPRPKLPKEKDVHRAMDKRDYKVKMQSSFLNYILRPWIWVLISAILISVLVTTNSIEITGAVAGVIVLGLLGLYVVWHVVTYLFLFVCLSIYKLVLSLFVGPKEKR